MVRRCTLLSGLPLLQLLLRLPASLPAAPLLVVLVRPSSSSWSSLSADEVAGQHG
jgi:hypothetical protein